MSTAVEENLDTSPFTLAPLNASLPSHKDEKRASTVPDPEVKIINEGAYRHAPWLLRRTSIHVESTPSNVLDDDLSDIASVSTAKSDEKRAMRNLLGKLGRQKSSEQTPADHASIAESQETSVFGTTVSIEATQPRKLLTKQRELKGLEQAASVKRWAGSGRPAEAWGKLLKDPELWDPKGDTFVYFGYFRPQASFRIQSSVLQATKSEHLIGKLQDGHQRTSKVQSSPIDPLDAKKQTATSVTGSTSSGAEYPVRYEIHFPPPAEGSKTTVLRHHVTTRNLLAVLFKKPLVGLTFYQALVDLHQRLQLYMPRDIDCTQLLTSFLSDNDYQNVSNDPAAAAGLLAWCEEDGVRWREGWREGFVHCCGMFMRLVQIPEFGDISQVSRTLLERSYLELEARITNAEKRLSTFDFDDVWTGSEVQLHPSRVIFDQFRRFLQQYYTRVNKHWPPRLANNHDFGGSWLTSSIVFRLQKDFAALYEFHVDRGVVWDKRKDPGAMHRNFVQKVDHQVVETNGTEICLARLFSRFDEESKYAHMPHPFPLLPDIIKSNNDTKSAKTSFFSSKAKVLEKQIIHAFSEASNATLLGPDIAANGLAEAFLRFEKSDQLGNVDLQSARKARWILLYGVLQVLSTLSVDTPDLFFSEGVSYFLNPRLKGTPPWRKDKNNYYEEASAKLSWCWVAPELSWGQAG